MAYNFKDSKDMTKIRKSVPEMQSDIEDRMRQIGTLRIFQEFEWFRTQDVVNRLKTLSYEQAHRVLKKMVEDGDLISKKTRRNNASYCTYKRKKPSLISGTWRTDQSVYDEILRESEAAW